MAKKNAFDFSQVRNTPAVKAAEREITEGFEQMSESTTQPAGQGGVGQQSANQPTAEATPTLKPVPEITAPQQPIVQTIPAAVAIGEGERTQNINVPIPVSLHQRLKMISVTKRQNMKDLVTLAIKEYVERADTHGQ